MREEKVQVVHGYLAQAFGNATIEYKHDFDLDAESFKVFWKGDVALLKVAGEFLDDNGEGEIHQFLNLCGLSDVLAKEKELGVLVTQDGLRTFER